MKSVFVVVTNKPEIRKHGEVATLNILADFPAFSSREEAEKFIEVYINNIPQTFKPCFNPQIKEIEIWDINNFINKKLKLTFNHR